MSTRGSSSTRVHIYSHIDLDTNIKMSNFTAEINMFTDKQRTGLVSM